ncbi:hypothetical protein M501DRAFT_508081 [Patellaria atrata CBS 101060]|uniref:Uncharacterized protein n=1 Tax=Patellaria atrata CBS 101060 TaxID=1346257 RepID=A0A9P4S3R8_9PEZI|nr:hypothetical protein M501DRAFT_508081 [Patellaria atrata CBS 101060]
MAKPLVRSRSMRLRDEGSPVPSPKVVRKGLPSNPRTGKPKSTQEKFEALIDPLRDVARPSTSNERQERGPVVELSSAARALTPDGQALRVYARSPKLLYTAEIHPNSPIGVALGSPTMDSPWNAHPSVPRTRTPKSSITTIISSDAQQEVQDISSDDQRPKFSRWKSIGSIFGRKASAPTLGSQFYQLQEQRGGALLVSGDLRIPTPRNTSGPASPATPVSGGREQKGKTGIEKQRKSSTKTRPSTEKLKAFPYPNVFSAETSKSFAYPNIFGEPQSSSETSKKSTKQSPKEKADSGKKKAEVLRPKLEISKPRPPTERSKTFPYLSGHEPELSPPPPPKDFPWRSPRTPKLTITGPESPPQADLSNARILDVDIPSVQMERYSVMFGNVLNTAASSSSSLLSRRQGPADRLKPLHEMPYKLKPTRDGNLSLQPRRRTTSPLPEKSPRLSLFPQPAKSPRLSLFPPIDTLGSQSPRTASPAPSQRPLKRSVTGPVRLSPNKAAFAPIKPSPLNMNPLTPLTPSPNRHSFGSDVPLSARSSRDSQSWRPALQEPHWSVLSRSSANTEGTLSPNTPLTGVTTSTIASIQIARQVSVSRPNRRLQLPNDPAEPASFVDRKAMIPTLVELRNRKSQRVQLEHA